MKKRIKTKQSRHKVFIFYEGGNMENAIKTDSNYVKIEKAPDCVYKTIARRMDELNKEISDYEEILIQLKAEYAAHANFILNDPESQRNLSHDTENKD